MAVDKKKLQKGPDLDRFLEVGKRHFTTYARGAGIFRRILFLLMKWEKVATSSIGIYV